MPTKYSATRTLEIIINLSAAICFAFPFAMIAWSYLQ
jgi:hypothetical protein